MKFVLMANDYGPFKKDKSYQVRKEGRDWVRLKANGKSYHVSKVFTYEDPFVVLT